MTKFFSIENAHKWGWGVLSVIGALIVTSFVSGFTDKNTAIEQGREAYREVGLIKPKVDSLEKCVERGDRKLDVFLQIQRVRDSVLIDGFKEIKSDLKEIKKR